MKTHLLSFVFVALIATSSSFANNLSLIGDAMPGGWSLDSAIVMKPVADGIYEFVGDLKDGSLKFVVQHDFVPSYGPQTNGDLLEFGIIELTYRASYEEPDNAFSVKAGRYALTLDMSDTVAKLAVSDGTGLPDKWYVEYPDTIYAVGNATQAGWSAIDAIAMAETADNSGVYVDTLLLTPGELKFLCQKDWGAGYGASIAYAPITGAGEYALMLLDSTDMKFVVAPALPTEYVVAVNLMTRTLTLHSNHVVYPNTLYILGPAVGGWRWDDNTQIMLSHEEGIYTWQGNVVEGELKFFVEKDFLALAFGATHENTVINDSGEYTLALLGQEDNKFVAPNAQVQMTVNLKAMTLSVVVEVLNALQTVTSDDAIMLYDIMGNLRMVRAEQMSTNALPAGIYIVKTATQSKKIIVK